MKRKVELLAPAGDLNKMKYALAFGADAVYCGLPDFSLRVRINRFTTEDLKRGVEYTHRLKKKVYVTLNIYAHNRHLKNLPKHIAFLKKIKADGIIASDPGVISLIKKHWPKAEIHLSTQANATNLEAVKFWGKQGIKRIILAREITLKEIGEIKKAVPQVELEYFVHGAMCMSYSGRCILSKWMTNRSANLGDCSQPCRWAFRETGSLKRGMVNSDYKELSVIDDQKRFEMDVEEDNHGTYFFNSYDLNLLEHLDKLLKAGVDSLKIEGRAKSAYYLAVVTRAYRKVLDAMANNLSKKELKKIILEQKKELDTLAHRGYSTGFLLGQEPAHNFENRNNQPDCQFVGEVLESKGNLVRLHVHNQIFLDDQLEAITPEKNIKLNIKKILDFDKKSVVSAHGGNNKDYFFEFDQNVDKGSLLRKKF